jgi:DNA-binding response OmpR family regulator
MTMRIALLEDDIDLAKVVALWLQAAGHDCRHFANGRALINALHRDTFDMLVLDWIVPDTSGEEVLRWARQHLDWRIPVIFTTVRNTADDIARILDAGADDYVTKPIREKELLARINALARRTLPQEQPGSVEQYGRFTIDTDRRQVSCDDEAITLTEKEFELVLFLFRHAGRLLSRGHILEAVWGKSADLTTRTLDTHISRVRNKLGLVPENGWRLKGIYQQGYRLESLETGD